MYNLKANHNQVLTDVVLNYMYHFYSTPLNFETKTNQIMSTTISQLQSIRFITVTISSSHCYHLFGDDQTLQMLVMNSCTTKGNIRTHCYKQFKMPNLTIFLVYFIIVICYYNCIISAKINITWPQYLPLIISESLGLKSLTT